METQKVGIREFRDNLSTYLMESKSPVAITRHGETIGFYLPAPQKRTDADRLALRNAAAQVQDLMAANGIKEDEILADFKQWRKKGRK